MIVPARATSWVLAAVALHGLGCARPGPPTAASPPPAGLAAPAAPDRAARAELAALYALPLVTMDLTREQFFAQPATADATPNRFLHIPILGNPTFRAVVRPNVDTLYSTAWLDLTAEPVVMTLPPSDGRYFMIQCMDAWTNVFAAPGIRTLGNRTGKFAIVGPNWHGQLPAEIELVRSPTPMVWVLGRIYVRDPADLSEARAFQHRLDLRPWSRAGDPDYQAVYPRPIPPDAKRKIMRQILRELTPEALFERFARVAIANPASPPDPQFARTTLAPLGLVPGEPLNWAALDQADRSALAGGLERVLHALEDRASVARVTAMAPTGWSSMAASTTQGNYGTDYRSRAAVAMIGLGANLREDAVYMNASIDGEHHRLDGSKRYRLRFAAHQTPPVRAFWSITLYDDEGYLVANSADRYAIKSADPLIREPDGSLVIYLQPDDPGPEHRANWLPTPDHQRFELSLRAYWPEPALLNRQWLPPAVVPAP